MREQVLDDVLARRFLLGQLSPEEQGRIQELAFEDRDTFVFLESVEDDLIDEFIQGELSADEEENFKSHFMSLPGRHNNLKISRVMQQHFDKAADVPQKKKFSFLSWFKFPNTWLQISLAAAAALVLLIFAVWIFNRLWQARQPDPIQAGPDKPGAIPTPEFQVSPLMDRTASPAHVENKPNKTLTPEKQKRIATYALLAPSSSTRSEGVQQLKLAPNTPSMTIELPLITQSSYKTYEAALEDEAGKVLERWPNLREENLTSGKALKIDVPVTLLKPQEFYRIVVSGVSSKGEAEVIARYPFEVAN